ncbi:DUF305 domain-containing protein [Nocardia caishijiensis]|uniref:Uncharacterized protein (DUF305 family) n=1 Tax=Nocardia caishijiensis TaxID=184756 RepID=A0ABQ6YNE0_9NOCA|nr:DUF305 domain-containing protein [Nocardia caishijiensis]KAF0847327.1 uncharacterized protein (DUF305 family) [Nocardia caishijiensis]
MTMPDGPRRALGAAAALAVAVFLLVLGAALRPLVVPERATPAPVLSPTELGFVQDMTAHHQQAMLLVQRLDPAVDAGVLALAEQIADTQRVEIGTLLGWTQLAGAAPTANTPMSWMTAHHHSTGPTVMPGLVTQAELDALTSARGSAAEVLFLRLMYHHHAGGITMARAVDALLTDGPVKQAARSMAQSQSREMGSLGVLLEVRGVRP